VLDDGRICYRIKDTDQVRLMTPVQFLARLAALVPHRAIRWCASERDGEIEVAGPHLAQSLTELGLIDEYRIYLHPVVLGHGTP
jgi:dihydrofolate reductase